MTGRQLNKHEYEKLLWDARINPLTKLIAKAILFHMGKDKSEAGVSASRLAYMCGVDERTIRNHFGPIEKILGIEITRKPGKASTFQLRVFHTADELERVLRSDPWRDSEWRVFSLQRNPRKPDAPSDLERLTTEIQALMPASPAELPLNRHSGVNGSGDPGTAVHPGTVVHPTPEPSFRGPLNGDSAEPRGEPRSEPKHIANGAAAPKERKSKGNGAAKSDAEFDRFFMPYREALPKHLRTQRARKQDALKAWRKLNVSDRSEAIKHVATYAKELRDTGKGEYMLSAANYLTRRQFAEYADAPETESFNRERQVELLARVYAGEKRWTQGLTDFFGGEPGSQRCDIPPDVDREAQKRAAERKEAQNA